MNFGRLAPPGMPGQTIAAGKVLSETAGVPSGT